MENTSATVFSSRYVVDSGFEDRNYTNVNAHELAHQWFGFSHCPKRKTPLATGRICYLLCRSSRTRNMEMIISILNYTKQRSKLNMLLERIRFRFSMKTSSLSFLSKGAWALFALREAGDQAFKKAVRKYLDKYSFKV
jgi:aminopeptidase N